MSKFIELTSKATGDEIYFSICHIEIFYAWENGGVVITDNCDIAYEERYLVKETPAEIMAKIQEVQNDWKINNRTN